MPPQNCRLSSLSILMLFSISVFGYGAVVGAAVADLVITAASAQ